MRTCKYCDKDISYKSKSAKYCDAQCGKKFNRNGKKPIKFCLYCGARFDFKNIAAKFCCTSHGDMYHRGNSFTPEITICTKCGKLITIAKYQNSKLYCELCRQKVINIYSRKWKAKGRKNLSDDYIKSKLVGRTNLSFKYIPQELIKLKRAQLLLIKEVKYESRQAN